MYKIVDKIEEVPNVHKLVIKEPKIAQKAKPGQFVIVMVDEYSERIPLSIADTSKDTFTIFVLELGISTAKIAKMNKGDS
ncbi:MAG: hypothetical protein H7641_09315, partial [Candidatus Heimdallarchaeota archaeon]|nr:hypothetical protein [Candidatus Heimdallarchaeota archaeon]MCK4877764.1 hypothetical protein [Candidatus Heimdallarchaeota archaeon]